jgi:diaminohydroxyphosphoribosylaminopyrimidine deaminase/5-amino-6-(5-phosphoribosylamino)uracil reductase
MTEKDKQYMQLAIELAAKGKGGVNPNPLVGAVIVKNDEVIAEGWHEICGQAHAEINAFKDADKKNVNVEGATMYVTLEPCSHFGKTPPCAVAIIERKIARVIVGQMDPNPIVAGRGIKMIKEAGIEVECGIFEKELKYQNRVFLNYVQYKLPWVVMKTAMTLDGKIASYTGDSRWVSCNESRVFVHELRNELQAIMVGAQTIITDNPELTCRLESRNGRNPIRVVVDSTCKIPLFAKVLDTNVARTIIATTNRAYSVKMQKLKDMGVEIIIAKQKNKRVCLQDLMQRLGYLEIDGLLLEGGGRLNYSALNEGIVDELMSIVAPKIIGGCTARTPVGGEGIEKMNNAISLTDVNYIQLGEDLLINGLIEK